MPDEPFSNILVDTESLVSVSLNSHSVFIDNKKDGDENPKSEEKKLELGALGEGLVA